MLRTMPVVAVALACGLATAGQARAQTTAAAPQSNLESNWTEGSNLVRQGALALAAGDKQMTDAARRGVEASRRRTTAGANSKSASEEFRRLASSAPTSTDAAEAQRWAAIVQAAAAKWQVFQTQESDATRDLNVAIQQNSAAQKAIEAAMVQIDRGRRMVGEPQPVEQASRSAPKIAAPAPVQ